MLVMFNVYTTSNSPLHCKSKDQAFSNIINLLICSIFFLVVNQQKHVRKQMLLFYKFSGWCGQPCLIPTLVLLCWSLSMLCCKTVHLFSLLSAVSFCADRSSTIVSVDILWLLILSKYMLCTVSILTWLNTMSAQGNKCQI